jgi:hypothetical protein
MFENVKMVYKKLLEDDELFDLQGKLLSKQIKSLTDNGILYQDAIKVICSQSGGLFPSASKNSNNGVNKNESEK